MTDSTVLLQRNLCVVPSFTEVAVLHVMYSKVLLTEPALATGHDLWCSCCVMYLACQLDTLRSQRIAECTPGAKLVIAELEQNVYNNKYKLWPA